MYTELRNTKGQFTGVPKVRYESGDKYGFLMLTGKCFMKPYGGDVRRFVEVICKCGKCYFTNFQSLRSGTVVSCGCHKNELLTKMATKHGMARNGNRHQIYDAWVSMRNRCYNENDIGFHNYGGRGVFVCLEWKDNFLAFKKWALENGWKKGLTLDRVDNEFGNYEPSNCRWANYHTQSRNKRNNHNLTAFGETKCLQDWVNDARCTVSYGALFYRIKIAKWDTLEAITTPPLNK